jgi:hypothetical protein
MAADVAAASDDHDLHKVPRVFLWFYTTVRG